jgi:hypothetical protein
MSEQRKINHQGHRRGAKGRSGQRQSSYISRTHDPLGPSGKGKLRRPQPAPTKKVPDDMSLAVYLDTDDEFVIADVLTRVEILRTLAGYGGPERDVKVQRGSIFRRSWAAVRRGLSSSEVRDRLAKIERALELGIVDQRQAVYDQTEAAAVAQLLASLQAVPRACIRLGSIMLVKYAESNGDPVVLVRTLSQSEIRIFEQYPAIQRSPERAIELLAMIAADAVEYSIPPASGFGS